MIVALIEPTAALEIPIDVDPAAAVALIVPEFVIIALLLILFIPTADPGSGPAVTLMAPEFIIVVLAP